MLFFLLLYIQILQQQTMHPYNGHSHDIFPSIHCHHQQASQNIHFLLAEIAWHTTIDSHLNPYKYLPTNMGTGKLHNLHYRAYSFLVQISTDVYHLLLIKPARLLHIQGCHFLYATMYIHKIRNLLSCQLS